MNDYCVSGKRITVYDGGEYSQNATPGELLLITAYELDAYAVYLQWHAEQKVKFGEGWPPVEPYEGLIY